MLKPRPQVDPDMVARFRKEFFEQYTEDGHNEAYDPRDVETFRSSDKYVHKFLMIAKMDLKVAGEKVNTVLKWRKQFGLNDLKLENFDDEVLSPGGFYVHNLCNIGRRIFWFRVCKYKKNSFKTLIGKQLLAFWLNKLESEKMGDDVVILMDCTNAGLANVDMEVVRFMISCFELYFPALVGIMLVYNMHWVLNAVWKLIEKLLAEESRDHIKFVRGAEIYDFIVPAQLPSHMGGTDKWEWTWPLPEEEKDLPIEIDAENNDENDTMMSIPNGEVTSDPSPQNSPSLKPRRVHFAAETKRAGLVDEEDGLIDKKQMHKRSTKKQKQNIHKGALLNIKPGDQLVFEEPSLPADNEPSVVMSLTNTTSQKVAYKIKTTTPDRYKVRPSAGPINAGASINITITLLSGDKDEVARDKFLVISTELTEVLRTPAELTEFWKKVDKDDISEHRVRCVYQITKKPEMDIAEVKRDMTVLKSKVDSLTQHVATIAETTTKVLRLVLLQFLLFVCFALYNFVFRKRAATQHLECYPDHSLDQCPLERDM